MSTRGLAVSGSTRSGVPSTLPRLQPAMNAASAPAATSRSCRMRPFLGMARELAHRQTQSKMCALELSVDDLDGAAVGVGEFEHHRESDAGALDVTALGSAPLVEGLEDTRPILRRDAGTGIGDVEHQLLALAARMQMDRAAARR